MTSFLDISSASLSDDSNECVTSADATSTPQTSNDISKTGSGELVNTSSLSRKLASASTPSEKLLVKKVTGEMDGGRDTPPIDWEVGSSSHFSQVPRDMISSDIKRNVSFNRHISVEDETANTTTESMTTTGHTSIPDYTKSESDVVGDNISPGIEIKPAVSNNNADETTDSPPNTVIAQSISDNNINMAVSSDDKVMKSIQGGTPPQSSNNNSNNNNGNPFDAFISFFFQQAEVYEEELEIRQSQRNLQLQLDKQRHGVSSRRLQGKMPLSPEGGSTSSEDDIVGLSQRSSTPNLTEKGEALAAVEAMSSFMSLKEVKKQLKDEHSFDKEDVAHDQKKQKIENDDDVADEVMKNHLREEWKAFVKEKKQNKFNEVAIESLALPLTVDEFYHHVLEDGATHSIGKFMTDIGELNVDTTPWHPAKIPTASEPTTRTIHYTHPVNAPMAPPTAKARKQQFFNKVGDVGLCVETCTIVEEVPMADCFVVEDRLWVHESEDGNGCIVAVTFQIRFVKGTMFRRIIESTTRKEYESFWNQFADMILSLKGSGTSLEEEELADVAMELEKATSMLEGEGLEVPLSSVLSRIRTSTRRLSTAAKLPSTRKMMHTNEAKLSENLTSIDVQQMITFVLDGLAYIRKQISESDYAWALAVTVFFFNLFMNMITLRQIGKMNGFLQNLEKMNEINAMLLTKLADAGDVCNGGSCLS